MAGKVLSLEVTDMIGVGGSATVSQVYGNTNREVMGSPVIGQVSVLFIRDRRKTVVVVS